MESKTSPHPILEEHFSQEDSCPNLTPAYSCETPNMEDKCNITSCENIPNKQDSSICSATPTLSSEHQKVDPAKTSPANLFPYPQFNKIKIEVPDAILSNHVRIWLWSYFVISNCFILLNGFFFFLGKME